MARKIETYTVVVEPDIPTWWKNGDVGRMRDRAEEIVQAVQRHVYNVRQAWAEPEYTCEHCGAAWTESAANYNGGCCDQDEAANPNSTSPERAP